MRRILLLLSAFAATSFVAPAASPQAATTGSSCTLLADSAGKILFEEGDCDRATTPASTFKIPLALMGFDAGILTGPLAPLVPYADSIGASLPSHRAATDPTRWMTESVVWYSQRMTRILGRGKFQGYVDRFGYGNRDLAGDPGRDDGLTRAWLSSSLAISPRAQLAFLAKVRARSLGVSPKAYAMLDSLMPRFPGPDGWTVAGKTGSGFPKDSSGAVIEGGSVGWLAGWLERDGRARLLFVRREVDLAPPGSYGGPVARRSFLEGLPGWLARVGVPAKP